MPRNSIISGAVSPEDYQRLRCMLGHEYTMSAFINHMVQMFVFLEFSEVEAFMEAQPFVLAAAIEKALPKEEADTCSLPL